MNRIEIKEEAKKILSDNLWNFWKAMLLVMLISFGASVIIGTVVGNESNAGQVLNFLLELALVPLSIGFLKYVLNIIRGEEFAIDKLFDYYKIILPIVAASVLASILIVGGTILLIVPGIIIALALTMVNPIFADGETDPIEALKRSHEMMKGYKWDYFVFILSFIGWILLALITCGIALIWVLPYMSVSTLLYYERLKNKDNVVKEEKKEPLVIEEKEQVEEKENKVEKKEESTKKPAPKNKTTKKESTKKSTTKKTTSKK